MRRPGDPVPDPDAVNARLRLEGLDVAAVLAACASLVLDLQLDDHRRGRVQALDVALAVEHAEPRLRVLERRLGRVVRFSGSGA